MYHHQISRTLAEARMRDLHKSACSGGRPHTRVVVLTISATIGLACSTAARAQPVHDVGSTTDVSIVAQHRDARQLGAPSSITFTNPLHRSRGVGAGGGQL